MSEAAASRRIVHKNPLSDISDQALFFTFFLIGSSLMLVLRKLGLPQYIVTAAPVSLMAIYALIALTSKRYRAREDRVGDNLYYLGFLFTLVSLSYTLWQFNSTDANGNIELVISNFGLALATTICVLALRVFFNQMREDPMVYEREARMELADAATAVKVQLDDVAVRMADFKRRITQQMAEGVSDMTRTASEALQTNVTKFGSVGEEVLVKINEAFEYFNQQSARLNLASGQTVDALHKLFERIDAIEASPDMLAKRLETVVGKFDEVADESGKRTRAHNMELKRTKDLVELAAKAAIELQSSIDAGNTSMDTRLSRYAAHLETGAKAVAGLSASVTAVTDALKSQMGVLASGADAVSNNLSNQIATSRTMLAEHNIALAADLETMRRHNAEIEQGVTEARQMTLTLERTLVSLSEAIVKKLNAA